MKKACMLSALFCLLVAGQGFAVTVNLDGILDEWTGPGVVNLGTQTAPAGGSYTLLATWDATNLYIGVDRNSTDRYLGDTATTNDSFFVAIDVDGVAGSGGANDGYGTVGFNGTMRPDFVYNYAGGEGWYETCSWNGTGYNWLGWSNAGTYYGWGETNPNDEFAIPLSTIGGSQNVMIWAWMTTEGVYDSTVASWPTGGTTMGDGIMIPEPATMGLLGLGSLFLARRKK